jgi:hypothetical protein
MSTTIEQLAGGVDGAGELIGAFDQQVVHRVIAREAARLG